MSPYIGFRINKILWRELKEIAAEKGVSLSHEIRTRLINYSELLKENEFYKRVRESLAGNLKQAQNQDPIYPLLAENNLLLRKIGRYTNTQLVMETDAQLENHIQTLLKRNEDSESQ